MQIKLDGFLPKVFSFSCHLRLSAEEVTQWSQSLEKLLASQSKSITSA